MGVFPPKFRSELQNHRPKMTSQFDPETAQNNEEIEKYGPYSHLPSFYIYITLQAICGESGKASWYLNRQARLK
jgi:hypothetical protein